MKKFDVKNIIDKMGAMSNYTKSFLLGLHSDIVYFIDHYCGGGVVGWGYLLSIAYCLFSSFN